MPIAGLFLIPNATFFVELVVFVVILFLVAKFILPPLNKAMAKRQEEIRASLEAADQAKADAEAADDERRNVLSEARQQAREIVAQANRTGEQVAAEAQVRGQAAYDRIVASAEAEVLLARQRAVDEISGRVGELVLAAAERVVGREIDVNSHQDLISQAVAAIRSQEAGVGSGEVGA